jgi:hypothetical protein
VGQREASPIVPLGFSAPARLSLRLLSSAGHGRGGSNSPV